MAGGQVAPGRRGAAPLTDTVRFSPLEHPAFARFAAARFLSILGLQIQSTAISWQVYNIARESRGVEESAFILGLVGLAQFVPLFFLALPGGQLADRIDRRRIILTCLFIEAGLSALLAASGVLSSSMLLLVIFGAAAGLGALRAFLPPALSATGPALVPRAVLPNALATLSLIFQLASITGPAVAGFLLQVSPTQTYLAAGVLILLGFGLVWTIPRQPMPVQTGETMVARIREGLTYVGANKVVLGAITLDLFVVLFAGATALLPVFARDVLQVGADGLGLMRSAGAVGAALVAFLLARRPLRRHLGRWMFAATALFGIGTFAFAWSTSFALSLAILTFLGMVDMLSVFVRQNLIQIATPDAMRGRVSAVSMLCISASNELGEFQSGVAARYLGPAGACVLGGVVAVGVTLIWMKAFPALRKADRVEDVATEI
jgi:MFS family permease